MKTSLARARSKWSWVTRPDAGLVPYLEKLHFNLVGYGCTTCIGNSGPLPDEVAAAAVQKLTPTRNAAVLSGNQKFRRTHKFFGCERELSPASPPLVVAYALAGRVDLDLVNEPIGQDGSGKDVFLREILWPTPEEVQTAVKKSVRQEMFAKQYAEVFGGDAQWNSIHVPQGDLYDWSDKSTYIKRAPYFDEMSAENVRDYKNMRALAMLGDSITTDHISPALAGNIAADSCRCRKYLISLGVKPADFNTPMARAAEAIEVMVREYARQARSAVSKIKWRLEPKADGPLILLQRMTACSSTTPRCVTATSASRAGDRRRQGIRQRIVHATGRAPKACLLLGVRAVIAESFERIPSLKPARSAPGQSPPLEFVGRTDIANPWG